MVSNSGSTPLMDAPRSLSVFWSRKLKPKIPNASGLASSFRTMRLSFSPTSMKAPSSRMVRQAALRDFLESFSMPAKVLQPTSITNSTNASRVPDVGGGPSTSIFLSRSLAFTSFHVLLGVAFRLAPSALAGTSLARAR